MRANPYFPTLIAIIIMMMSSPAMAQTLGEKVNIDVISIKHTILQSEGQDIHLWGVEPVSLSGKAIDTRARVMLGNMLDGKPAHCIIMQMDKKVYPPLIKARCFNRQDQDLGLSMIGAGLAITQRNDLRYAQSEVHESYLQAERNARLSRNGVWASLSDPAEVTYGAVVQQNPWWPAMITLTMALSPVIGFILLGMILWAGLKRLSNMIEYRIAKAERREEELRQREKIVLATSLEGELSANKSKSEAFIVIYKEMLSSMRENSSAPKYQQTGDIIQQKPALSRAVFDANIDRLELLGPDLAGELIQLYTHISSNPDYNTLEPETPIHDAIDHVENVTKEADLLVPQFEKTATALRIVMRERR